MSFARVLVRYQLKDELRIPRCVKKESAQGGVQPSHPAGVLSSSRLVWCLVELAASSALSCIVSATEQVLGVTLQERRVVQPCSAFAPRFFFFSFGVLYCKKSVTELSWPWSCLRGIFTLETAYLVGGYLTMIEKSSRHYTS